ncbi:MAG: transporter, partial [Hyphomicrobiaceae bacterium]
FEMTKVGAFSDAKLIDLASKHIHAHSLDAILAPSLAMAYGITSNLMISARIPYIARTDIREGHHSHVHGGGSVNEVVERGDSEGLGDLSAMLQWRFLNDRAAGTQWALLGGVKAPTGSTDRRDREGERFELEFQPGTGSWDWMAGLAVSQSLGRLSLHANVLHTFSGKGDLDTDLGDRLQVNLAAAYRLVGGTIASGPPMRLGAPMYHGAGRSLKDDHHHEEPASGGLALDGVLELNTEWHARQTIDGVKDDNSGGSVAYLSPGLRLSSDRWSSFVSVGIPVSRNLYGVQAEPDYRLLSGVAVSF